MLIHFRDMLWIPFLVGALSVARLNAQQAVDPAVEKRVASLIEVLGKPGAIDRNLEQTRDAIKELAKIGVPAVPQLVRSIVDARDPSAVLNYSSLALDEIGKPAVETVGRLFEPLSQAECWRLMRFRGKYDYDAAAQFAARSLDSKDDNVRRLAIEYHGTHGETRVREKLLGMLNEDIPQLRWHVIKALTRMPSDSVADALIALLDKNSWTARGDGQVPPPGFPPPWWPDGRPAVQEIDARKAAPAMLAVLQEKGSGNGYLAEFIIPALVEFQYTAAIDELRRVAAGASVDLFRSPTDWEQAKRMALEAVRQLNSLQK